MKILTGNYYNLNLHKSNPHNYSPKIRDILKCDTLCFRGRDLLDLPETDVIKKVRESVKPENFIGQGTDAEVYKINDSNYCVRIPHIANNMYGYTYSKDLSPIDKVNHVKIKLGFGATIMDYFDGVTPKEYQNNNYYRNIFQEKIAKFPIKSYTDFLHQIAGAIDNELVFDFSGGNLIVNLEKQKFTAIDFYNIGDNPRQIKPLCEMYSVLTCYGTKEDTSKKLFDKVINAGLEEFRPNNIPCMDVELFDFTDLVMKRNGDTKFRSKNVTEEISNILELKTQISQAVKELKNIKKEEIINKELAPILSEKISEVKKLLNKIH